MSLDLVGRYARSQSSIRGYTPTHENEAKTNTLGWKLYLVYAVLSLYGTISV